MSKKKKSDENEIDDNLTYEQKVEKLDEILTRLDNSETPIDKAKLSRTPKFSVFLSSVGDSKGISDFFGKRSI